MSDRPYEGFTDQQLSDYSGDVDARALDGETEDWVIRSGERLVAEVNARRGRR